MRRPLKREWRWTLIAILAVAVLSALGDRFLGLPYWVALGIVVVAMIANGLLAEWEDHRPGGFFNPTED